MVLQQSPREALYPAMLYVVEGQKKDFFPFNPTIGHGKLAYSLHGSYYYAGRTTAR